jgi:hypothetical protein
LELNCVLERLAGYRKHVIELLGLGHRSREAVEDESMTG